MTRTTPVGCAAIGQTAQSWTAAHSSGRRTGTASCGWPRARCTRRSATRAANAESVLRVARECHDDGVGAGGLPRADAVRATRSRTSCCRTRCWTRSSARSPTVVAASADLLPVLVVGAAAAVPAPDLQHRRRDPPRRGARRRAEVVPADLPGVLRAPPGRARRRRARHDPDRRASRCRSGPTCCSRPTDLPGLRAARRDLRGHVGAGAARARRRRWRARRCWPTCPAARSRSAAPRTARCWPARRRRAAWPPTSTPRRVRASRRTDLAWDGQTMIWENGVLLAESERFPKGERRSRSPTSTSTCCVRSGCGWARSTTTAATTRPGWSRFRRIEFRLDPPAGDIGLRREVERFPFVPADPARLEQDCYEAYNIQVAGPGAAAARAELPEGRDRGVRRPGLDARADRRRPGDGPGAAGRAATFWRSPCRASRPASAPRATRSGWRKALGVTFAEIDITRDRPADAARRWTIRSRAARRCTTSRSRTCRPGCAPTTCSALANQRGGIVLGTGDLSELALGWSHLRRRRPDVALQRQRRRAEDADPAPDPVGDLVGAVRRRGRRGAAVVLDTEITPELVPDAARTRRCRAARPRSGRMRCRTSRSSTCCATASGRRRSRSWPWHAWQRRRSTATGPPGFPADKRPAYSLTEIRHWLQVFAQRFYRSASSSGRRCRTGRRCRAGGSLSPRGDWRAPSDMSARIWLDEIAHIPQR